MPLECEVSSIHNKQWPAVWCSSSKGETCTTVVRASTLMVHGFLYFRAKKFISTLYFASTYLS